MTEPNHSDVDADQPTRRRAEPEDRDDERITPEPAEDLGTETGAQEPPD